MIKNSNALFRENILDLSNATLYKNAFMIFQSSKVMLDFKNLNSVQVS